MKRCPKCQEESRQVKAGKTDADPKEDTLDTITLTIARNFVTSLKDYSASTERVYTYALYGFLDELVADPEIDFSIDMYQLRGHGRKRLRTPPKRLPIFPKDEIELLLDYVVNNMASRELSDVEKGSIYCVQKRLFQPWQIPACVFMRLATCAVVT